MVNYDIAAGDLVRSEQVLVSPAVVINWWSCLSNGIAELVQKWNQCVGHEMSKVIRHLKNIWSILTLQYCTKIKFAPSLKSAEENSSERAWDHMMSFHIVRHHKLLWMSDFMHNSCLNCWGKFEKSRVGGFLPACPTMEGIYRIMLFLFCKKNSWNSTEQVNGEFYLRRKNIVW